MLIFEMLRMRFDRYQTTNPLEYDLINAQSWKSENEETLGYDIGSCSVRVYFNYANISICILPHTSEKRANVYHIVKPINHTNRHITIMFAKFQHIFKENSEIIQSIKDVFGLDFVDLNEKSYFEMSC